MTKRPAALMTKWLATVMLISACASTVRAQNAVGPLYSPYGAAGTDTDAEWFAPVDFDFENRPMRKDSGYFFRFDKLNWAVTGERATIGDPNVQILSEIIYDDTNPQDQGNRPPQYVIQNGLQDVVPEATFGWGSRYEFGLQEKGNGWLIGIIDGPQTNQQQTFGSGPQTSGFGSIHINFVTPAGYLLGFRDYFNNEDNVTGIVVGGPGVGGSGTPDDINGNLAEGIVTVFQDTNGNGEQDDDEPVIAVAEDFGDLAEFNVRFNQLTVRNNTRVRGVEVMRTIQLSNRHQMRKRQNNQVDLAYGVRFLSMRDEFGINGTSDFFRGLNTVTTTAENQIVGPQIRGKWSTQRGRWNMAVDGRFVFGYNIQDFDQGGTWGENIVPGALNQSMSAQPTTFSSGARANDFSPMVELRVDSTYQLTSSIALRLGYTAMFIDNISRASQMVEYRLPDWGIGQAGQQDVFINGVNFGFDINY